MSEPDERPDEPIGWTVTGPDGEVVATGGQTGLEAAAATADTGDDADGSD